MKLVLCGIFSLVMVTSAAAQRSSLLNNDPSVLYVKDDLGKEISFIVGESCKAFATKTGGRQLGVYRSGIRVELLEMTDKVYRVRGETSHGAVSGWVNPKQLLSKDADFIENLKNLYDRELKVRELIANQSVAIGMTIDEVATSLGEPSKKTSKITKDGRTGRWEFIEYNEEKKFNYIRDFRTGLIFKQFSHSTIEETAKIVIDFEDNVVTSIEESEDNGSTRVSRIIPPVVLKF